MKFLVDANMPRRTAQLFAANGYDCVDVRDIGLQTADDTTIAARAKAEARAIVSRDKGFGDIRQYPPNEYAGIIIVAVPEYWTVEPILRTVREFIGVLASTNEPLIGSVVVIEPGIVRWRTP